MKTNAAVLTEINKPLQVEELVLPVLNAGQVLVEIAYSGICHSQLNEIHGLKGEDRFLPHTLGHEGSGVVLEVGSDVSKVQCGDHVVLTWIKGTGHDVSSTQYTNGDGLPVNSGAISTFMSRAVISENRLVRIPSRMPLREAALLGCAVPTGAGIVNNTLHMQAGKSIAIWGLGGIGLSALLMAAYINADSTAPIIAIDINDDKLALAQELGATHTIHVRSLDPLTAVFNVTSGQGVDYAVEATGLREVMEEAFRCVRNQGGVCVLAGNLPQGQRISLDPFDLIKGKRIMGTWGGESNPDRDIPMQADWAMSGKLDLKKIICREFALADVNDAIDYMELHATGRVLIDMGHHKT
jgi:S-(hydroxymethyl)glutathione dehydrogenase/alcohol dehydrogenase